MSIRLAKDNKDYTLTLLQAVLRNVMYHALKQDQVAMIEEHFKGLLDWPDFECTCSLSTDQVKLATHINIEIKPLEKATNLVKQ